MISFKIDKQLQTISNYFLFSLAIADLAIGLISMPLFTMSTILGHWPLGSFVCDTWLALDYLASNASVLNLLIISFDRYFSVTRPLTYRAKRTTNRAAIMIASAWGISLLLWPPWIYSWPYIEGTNWFQICVCDNFPNNYLLFFFFFYHNRKANCSRIWMLHSVYRDQSVHYVRHSHSSFLRSRLVIVNHCLADNWEKKSQQLHIFFLLYSYLQLLLCAFCIIEFGAKRKSDKKICPICKLAVVAVIKASKKIHQSAQTRGTLQLWLNIQQGKIGFQLKNFFFLFFFLFLTFLKRWNFNNKSSNWRIHRSKFLAPTAFGRRQRKQ